MSLGTHVRLCLKDLYPQDVVEMVERETRKYEIESIEHPDHPDFPRAFRMLSDAFGPAGEMEAEAVIREKMLEERRARGKNDVALLPLPTGAHDLRRLKPLFRYDAYRKYYGPGLATDDVLGGDAGRAAAANPHWLDEQLAATAAELAKTPRWVYASRDKVFEADAPTTL